MIYEYICKGCGKTFTDNIADRVFCSLSCSATNRSRTCGMAHCDTSLNWKKVDGKWECPYQKNVGCTFRRCDKCGWNPEVAKARTEKFWEAYE